MAKNNNNNAEMLNEFVEALKFIRTTRKYTYGAFIEGAVSLIVKYNSTLERFVFEGYYNKRINSKVGCISCTSIGCKVREYIKNRYLV